MYHESCQLVSAAILPSVTTGVLFAFEIIVLWTGSPDVATHIAPIAALLLIGTACNALASMPYEAQVAHGWTKLALYSNVISFPVVIALIFLLSNWFGIMGVAGIWVIHNLLMLVITIPLMHRRILKQEFPAWFLKDTFIPFLVCAAFAGGLLGLEQAGIFIRNSLTGLIGFAIVIQSCTLIAIPFTRRKAFDFSQKTFKRFSHGN